MNRTLVFVFAAALAGLAGVHAADPAGPATLASGSAASATVTAKEPVVENGFLRLGFEHLAAFPFTPPPFDAAADPAALAKAGEEQIPPAVKSWSGRKVAIIGYMVPVKMEKGMVVELMLMRNTLACCFGTVPSMNEWVVVKMRKPIAPMMDVPIALYGDLSVGAIFENGYMTGLYRLEADRMEVISGS